MILNSIPWDVRGASVIAAGVEVSAILHHVGLSCLSPLCLVSAPMWSSTPSAMPPV